MLVNPVEIQLYILAPLILDLLVRFIKRVFHFAEVDQQPTRRSITDCSCWLAVMDVTCSRVTWLLVPPPLSLHPPLRSWFPPSVMLQIGDEAVCFSAVFLLVMLLTRRASAASLLTAFLYFFVAMFRFTPVPVDRAARVLRPGAASAGVPVLANRGGSHDAPENTLAAIREVLQKYFYHRDELLHICTYNTHWLRFWGAKGELVIATCAYSLSILDLRSESGLILIRFKVIIV